MQVSDCSTITDSVEVCVRADEMIMKALNST